MCLYVKITGYFILVRTCYSLKIVTLFRDFGCGSCTLNFIFVAEFESGFNEFCDTAEYEVLDINPAAV